VTSGEPRSRGWSARPRGYSGQTRTSPPGLRRWVLCGGSNLPSWRLSLTPPLIAQAEASLSEARQQLQESSTEGAGLAEQLAAAKLREAELVEARRQQDEQLEANR
jgi:hypothetical protein